MATKLFNSIDEAQQYCPPISGLIFYSHNQSDKLSVGTIVGRKDSATFYNDSPNPAPHPSELSQNNIIQDVQFRQASNGSYGREFAGAIECYYQYPYSQGQLSLVMSTITD